MEFFRILQICYMLNCFSLHSLSYTIFFVFKLWSPFARVACGEYVRNLNRQFSRDKGKVSQLIMGGVLKTT